MSHENQADQSAFLQAACTKSKCIELLALAADYREALPQVLELLRRLQREQGLRVLMNSHNVDPALRYSDRILGLRQGRVVFDGPPAAVTEAVLKDIYGGEAAHEAD